MQASFHITSCIPAAPLIVQGVCDAVGEGRSFCGRTVLSVVLCRILVMCSLIRVGVCVGGAHATLRPHARGRTLGLACAGAVPQWLF